MHFTCPICGYAGLDKAPYDEYESPSDDYCPCCCFQFGYHDRACGITYDEWREKWINSGMSWDSLTNEDPPANWDPKQQLLNIGIELIYSQKKSG